MKRFWLKTGAVAATTVWSLAAFAQSSSTTVPASATPSGTSTTDAAVVAPKKKAIPITIATDSTLYGPRVNTPTADKISADVNDREAFDGIFTRHTISAKYQLDEKTSIAPILYFDYQLTDPSLAKTGVRQFRWNDSFIRISRSGLFERNIKGNDVALDGDVRIYLPTSEGSRHANTIGSARLSLNPSVQFGKSPISFSMVNYAKYWAQRNTVNDAGRALPMAELYTGPQVNYTLSDKVTAFLLFETAVRWDQNGLPNNITAPLLSQTDVEPGVSLQVHDRISLTPFLNWYTNQPLYTTTLNLNAAVTLY